MPRRLPTLKIAELNLIQKTLEKHGWNRTYAADALGISQRSLRNKLNEMRNQGMEVKESTYNPRLYGPCKRCEGKRKVMDNTTFLYKKCPECKGRGLTLAEKGPGGGLLDDETANDRSKESTQNAG